MKSEENKEHKKYETVLLERLEGKIDAIIEEQSIIKEKVEKIDLLVEDMDYVKSEIVEIKDRFKETDGELEKKADKEVISDHAARIFKLESESAAKA